MSKAFVETTVLTNYLLKLDGSEVAAENAFKLFSEICIPQYAWKEFKKGPLNNFIWFHNKIVATGSLIDATLALQRISLSPKRYLTATAIQSMHSAFKGLFQRTSAGQFAQSAGATTNLDEAMTKALRLELKRIITKAWSQRAVLYGGSFHKLSCYPDFDLKERDGLFDPKPRDCPAGTQCCLKNSLDALTVAIGIVRQSIDNTGEKKELVERRKVLRSLEKHPTTPMGPKECQRFGDAYFVLFCPDGAWLLTTNVSDMQPMANALNIRIMKP